MSATGDIRAYQPRGRPVITLVKIACTVSPASSDVLLWYHRKPLAPRLPSVTAGVGSVRDSWKSRRAVRSAPGSCGQNGRQSSPVYGSLGVSYPTDLLILPDNSLFPAPDVFSSLTPCPNVSVVRARETAPKRKRALVSSAVARRVQQGKGEVHGQRQRRPKCYPCPESA
ncbi:hypothetical protein Bbelb_237850 [Branchiostoma belcheri]|nr:hypothetical protein Bbelb_237850 [Branchiostoma belcheri]